MEEITLYQECLKDLINSIRRDAHQHHRSTFYHFFDVEKILLTSEGLNQYLGEFDAGDDF